MIFAVACYHLILVCFNEKSTALLNILCLTCLLVSCNVLALCMRLLLLEKVGLRWSIITSVEKRLMTLAAFFLTGQTRSDPGRSFSPAAGETTGQTGSDRVWPFKRTQPLSNTWSRNSVCYL